jgi:pyruvate,orthophosphate dikinase
MENIVYFNKDLKDLDEKTKKRLGIRGRRAVELAMMGLPIAPGFIIDSELTRKLPQVNLKEFLKTHIDRLEKETKKGYGDPKKPLLLKVVLSSDFNVPYFPSIHNIGLNDKTVTGFGQFTGLDFAYGEYRFLLRSMGTKIYSLEAADFDKMDIKGGKQKAEDIKKAVVNFKNTWAISSARTFMIS